MEIKVREYKTEDVKDANTIWNQVVGEGTAFPQTEELNDGGRLF